jgi:spore coat-associated protein N
MSIKKKLAMGTASLAIGAALVGGGTFAYFNDVEESNGNTFAAGTIDLAPDLNGSALFNLQNQKPGDPFSGSYTVNNAGSLAIGKVKLTTSYTAVDPDSDGSNLGTQLKITSLTFGGQAVTLTDTDGDGMVTLDELDGVTLTLPGGIPVGGNASLAVAGEFHETGSPQNEYQGDSVSIDLSMEALQENSGQ